MSKSKKLNKVNIFKAIAVAISIINMGYLFGITMNDILGQGTYNVLKYSGSIIFFMQIFNFVVIFKLLDSFKKNVDKGIIKDIKEFRLYIYRIEHGQTKRLKKHRFGVV